MSHSHEFDTYGDRIPEERFIQECSDDECTETSPETVAHDLGGWGDFDTLRESLLPRIFGHMVQLATPIVHEFHGDLFHDAEWLRREVTGPCSFDFLVRHSGTNLGASAMHMLAIGAPGGVLYRLTVGMEDRGRWSLTVTKVVVV